jgi:hypothetical protein
VGSDTGKVASGPSPGQQVASPARLQQRSSPAEFAVVAGLGHGGGAAAYVESWGNRLPAAGPGRLIAAVQRRPLHQSPPWGDPAVGVRVGLLIPKTTHWLFKLDACLVLTIRSAGRTASVGRDMYLSLWAIARASGTALCPAERPGSLDPRGG